jgi:hypothetical protein
MAGIAQANGVEGLFCWTLFCCAEIRKKPEEIIMPTVIMSVGPFFDDFFGGRICTGIHWQ